jgi:hypothetical protein
MRPARNRYWGHPDLIDYIEKLAARASRAGWRGILVGDLSKHGITGNAAALDLVNSCRVQSVDSQKIQSFLFTVGIQQLNRYTADTTRQAGRRRDSAAFELLFQQLLGREDLKNGFEREYQPCHDLLVS